MVLCNTWLVKETDNLKKFYPTNDLVTGPDIIFFWVARMIMAGLYFKNEIPFTSVYFNGIIRDSNGRKMSKSLGNSPDPLDLIENYGSDALRVGLLLIAPQGSDILFSEEKIEHGRNFMNKLWNSARFILMNVDSTNNKLPKYDNLHITDKWIISKLHTSMKDIEKHYDNYKLNEVIKNIYDFVYNYFCDWYIEFTKTRFYDKNNKDKEVAGAVSIYVLKNILKMLHPFTPFITEEIWQILDIKNQKYLINSEMPKYKSDYINNNIENDLKTILDVISAVRNIKASLNIAPSKTVRLYLRGKSDITQVILKNKSILNRLAKIEKIESGVDITKPNQSATAIIKNLEIFIPLKGLININDEINRLEKQIEDMNGRLNSIYNKLNNENFVKRAPKQVVEHEKNKKIDYESQLEKLQDNLNALKD